MIRSSQHWFMKGLSNLVSFFDRVTSLADEGKAVDVVYLNFSKASNTVSHSILLEKLAAQWLRWMHSLLGKKLAGWLSPESGGEWSYVQLVASH